MNAKEKRALKLEIMAKLAAVNLAKTAHGQDVIDSYLGRVSVDEEDEVKRVVQDALDAVEAHLEKLDPYSAARRVLR
jgi:hypothetical protein